MLPTSEKPSIEIRAPRSDESDEVVRLVRTGLRGLIKSFRTEICFQPRIVVPCKLFLIFSIYYYSIPFAVSVFMVIFYVLYKAPHSFLNGYFQSCADHADMYSYYKQDGHKLLVAVAGSQIVGSVAISPVDDDDECADLRRMTVHKNFRRFGIARQLLQRAEEYSRSYGYKRIELTTSAAQAAAQQLYESCGYTNFKTHFHRVYWFFPIMGINILHFGKRL